MTAALGRARPSEACSRKSFRQDLGLFPRSLGTTRNAQDWHSPQVHKVSQGPAAEGKKGSVSAPYSFAKVKICNGRPVEFLVEANHLQPEGRITNVRDLNMSHRPVKSKKRLSART